MKKINLFLFLNIAFVFALWGQSKSNQNNFLSDGNLSFLEDLTKDVMESSRIYPGQTIVEFGSNNSGGTLIRPGGRSCYPAFWIRDYAMSLESGFVTKEEQKHMLLLTASTQCDQTWITKGGSMVPYGAVADHIRIDDRLPIFFPGTFSFEDQGIEAFGKTPPYGDQYFFIHMAYFYFQSTSSPDFLLKEIKGIRMIDRLEMAFKVPPTEQNDVLVFTTDHFRGVDFGFRDVITITGKLCFPSILKYRASLELAELYDEIKRKDKADVYRAIARELKTQIPMVFSDKRGMLLASTEKSKQPDVWSTALAVYFGILEGEQLNKTCQTLATAYKNGTLAYRGNIRHVLTSDDFNGSTAWEFSLAKKNTYQNGAYWGTPTGWVCYAIAKENKALALKLANEYIDDLRANDYRKGGEYEAPFECFHPSGNKQNPVYLTTVTCPYAAFKSLGK